MLLCRSSTHHANRITLLSLPDFWTHLSLMSNLTTNLDAFHSSCLLTIHQTQHSRDMTIWNLMSNLSAWLGRCLGCCLCSCHVQILLCNVHGRICAELPVCVGTPLPTILRSTIPPQNGNKPPFFSTGLSYPKQRLVCSTVPWPTLYFLFHRE